MNTKIIKLDINTELLETITAKQGDTKSRFILFNLYDGAIPFDLSGRTVRVYGQKQDNTAVFNDLEINDAKNGYCTLELTNQMLAVEGMYELELVIFEGDKRLSTMPFILNVIGSKYSDDAIMSTNEFTALTNALKTVGEIENKADKKEVEKLSSQLDTKTSFCNTITDLKNSNFKNGDIVKTLGYYNINDGGDGYYIVRIKKESDIEDNGLIHFLNNNLVAELIIIDKEINILQFGAKNDKSKDIGLLVNNLLSKYKSIYIPRGKYLVENTIKPLGENTLKIDGALYYTGNESCILVETMHNKITTFDIFAEGNAVKLMNSTNESKCAYNYIDLKGFVRSNNDHALTLYSSQMGINYNEINFQTLKAPSNKNAIYIKTDGTSTTLPTFINENIIKGGQCTGGEYGVYIDTTADKYRGEVNGMKFSTISFEGVANAIYLNNARANVFEYIRVAEVDGLYAKFVGECDCNKFNILSLVPPSKFDVSEISTSKGNNNFISCEVINSGYNRVGKDLIIRRGKIVPAQLLDKINAFVVGTSDGNYTYTNDTFYNYLNIVSKAAPTITLNNYFCSSGLNELYVRIQAGSTFTLKDSNSVLIHSYTNSSGTDELFKYICFNNSNSDSWIKIKLTPIW